MKLKFIKISALLLIIKLNSNIEILDMYGVSISVSKNPWMKLNEKRKF